MKDKILAALKTEYKNLGFSEKALQGVADALASTNLVTDENLDAIVKGQKAALTAMQSEIDSRVTTAVEKAKKDIQPGTDPVPGKDPVPTPGAETPEQKAIRELKEQIAGLVSGKTHETLEAKVRAQLKEKNVPEPVINLALNNRNFQKEEEIEPFVTQVETAHKEYVQNLNDRGLGASYQPPASAATTQKKVEDDIKGWAEKTNPKPADK